MMRESEFERLFPVEALSVANLPRGKQWRYEPKWDGFRCLVFKHGNRVLLRSKSGRPLNRYFPDIVAVLEAVPAKSFIVDGELLVKKEGHYSFSELQLRLHPAASRVQKLAAQHPASLMLFDMLQDVDGQDLMALPLSERRQRLEQFHKECVKEKHLLLSPQTASISGIKSWLDKKTLHLDGVIAKREDEPYAPGERQMQKFKFIRTADCVVGGFRYGTNSKLVGSLLLGLYDDKGLLHHVGFTSAIAKEDKPALTKKLEKLIAAPGFTGRAPGGPSRWGTERSAEWQPLKPTLVAEVGFDHVSDERFRHGTRFIRWRLDKSPHQCRMEQL